MVEPGTGDVKALAQSRPMGTNKKKGETFLNYVVPKQYGDSNGFQAGRPSRSFVLAAAIKQQIPLNTTINSPRQMFIPQIATSRPATATTQTQSTRGTCHSSTSTGPMTLYTGTRESVNTFYAQLERMTGHLRALEARQGDGHRASCRRTEDGEDGYPRTIVPSFTLGISDTNPLEMAEAYATFANRGSLRGQPGARDPRPQRQGHPHARTHCDTVMKPAEADAVNDVLEGVIDGGFASAQALSGHPAAGKTGTIDSHRAVWFVGYTPNMSTAAMVAGANQFGEPITLIGQTVGGRYIDDASGSGNAAPMWGAGDASDPPAPARPELHDSRPDRRGRARRSRSPTSAA